MSTTSKYHAVLHIGYEDAQILQFDAEEVASEKVHAHNHYTRQHGSNVRTEHEFHAHVCDSLAGIAEVLVAGSHAAQAAFRHYVEKHRPAVAKQIAGWETVDHPTQPQLVALARKYFVAHDRMTRKD